MSPSSDNSKSGLWSLGWPIILELLIAPPATIVIVALLTWHVHPAMDPNGHTLATASVLTPLALLAYLALQALGLFIVIATSLALYWIKGWYNKILVKLFFSKIESDPEFIDEILSSYRPPRMRRHLRDRGNNGTN